MRRAIFADDWTGACDVAATAGAPVWVPAHLGSESRGSVLTVFNLETRGMTPAEARHTVRRALAEPHCQIVYWKMDSLLRGNWAHEVAEAWSAGAVKRLLVCPAFPEQHRIMCRGIQYAHGVEVGPVSEPLRSAGLPVSVFRVVDDPGEAAACLALDETPVGSAGLARRLWNPRQVRPAAVEGIILVVVGTRSERGCAQIEPLRNLPGVCIVEPDARPALVRAFQAAFAETNPAALVVAGGDTLRGVVETLLPCGLMVEGEISPGVALARLVGGIMDGKMIITKAGDFGDPGTLLRAVRALQGVAGSDDQNGVS